MKIAIINLDNGGIMHYAVDLVNSLIKENIDVRYIGYSEAKELLHDKCKIDYINKRDFWQLKKYIVKLIKENKIDIIHFSGYHIFFLMLIPSIKKYGVKIVYTLHDVKKHPSYIENRKLSMNTIKEGIIYSSPLRNKIAKKSDKVITLSNYVKSLAEEVFNINSEVILLSQNIDRYNKISRHDVIREKSNFNILFFGIVDKYKGVEDLLEALCIAEDDKYDFKLTIAGKQKGNEIIIPEKISKKVIWINRFIEEYEIESIFNNCDIVILPYKEVSQSGVISMAMAYNKPVICTEIGSFKEYVINSYNGFFVKENSPKDISDKIKYLIDNKDKINELKKNCSEIYLKKLSWNILSKKYIEIYKEIIKVEL